MDDRQILAFRAPADASAPGDAVPSCFYCLTATGEDIAADAWPPRGCPTSTCAVVFLPTGSLRFPVWTDSMSPVRCTRPAWHCAPGGLADGGHSDALTARGICHRSSWPNSMRSPGSAHGRSAC